MRGAQLAAASWWSDILSAPRVTRSCAYGCLCSGLVANANSARTNLSTGKREGGRATAAWPITASADPIAAEPHLGEIVARPTAQALVWQGGVYQARRAIQAREAIIGGVIVVA